MHAPFATPEAMRTLQQYIDFRKTHGEDVHPRPAP